MKYLHLSLFALVCLMSNVAHANEYQKHGLEVTGKGAILIDPDVFTFSITIADRAVSAEQSKQVVDEKSQDILAVAKSLGVKDDNIETAQMLIRPIFDHSSQNQDSLYQPALIEVSRKLTFILNDFAHYDPLMERAIVIGVKHISGLNYQTEKADMYYRQAMDIAIEDAKAKAQQLAKQLNVKVGKVTYMAEIPVNAPRVLRVNDDAETSRAVALTSTPGRREIAAQVVINFSIK
ncbi:SIMPL domain-containing protein [Thalassotalea sp. Y01]|uniref:SIMPL domain-containing protein n=1 Tax=Thalassotalea sp. Y01 TaxID=2729613 RepID=UPI00145C7DB0|nr:SIMPL domain-containing protein [Thalassotalea sp. Y01]NMP15540.1 SIMPL domain-containing protein [Thalassotalea sp. Y01]